MNELFVTEVALDRAALRQMGGYLNDLPCLRELGALAFHRPVTYFVGENGTGKSTLLEGLAVALGLNPEGGGRNFHFASKETHSPLHRCLTVTKGPYRPQTSYFLRAESFYNLASEVDRLEEIGAPGLFDSYGGRSLHSQSHGEAFLSLVLGRFPPRGLYLLDEPEAALSPSRQLALLRQIHLLAEGGSQFIIATHSPILMALPGTAVLSFEEGGGHPPHGLSGDQPLPGHPRLLGGARADAAGTAGQGVTTL
ncbi:AAA family ATPase [Oscillospiraceae bacterium 52-8]